MLKMKNLRVATNIYMLNYIHYRRALNFESTNTISSSCMSALLIQLRGWAIKNAELEIHA